MSSEADINAIVQRWRTNVKKKFRGIASFEERAQLRFDAVRERIYIDRQRLDDWRIRECRYRAVGEYDWIDPDWRPIRVGQTWGGNHISAFFQRAVEVPRRFAGKRVVLRIYVGGDSLLRVNGEPYHGLDPFRHEVLLAEKAKGNETWQVELESYIAFNGGDDRRNEFAMAELAAVDPEMAEAYWDLWAVAKALQIVDIDPKLEAFLTEGLWEAMKLIPLREPDRGVFKAAVLEAQRRVRRDVYGPDRFKGQGLMHLVGHSHLDWVFMWPQKEFVRKVGRTHATMLRLMEQYPQFRFCQSQAKLYADMKRHHPRIYEQVKARIAEGRWEPIGAFWIEPDCNLISGESFVRQIIHGQRFFQKEFGLRSRTCWQPDVFGLSWGMPQILRRAGIEYFLTSKMVAWNDTNPWTLNTFWWEGPDGSRVLGIVPPGHFIGTVDPDVLDMQWRNFSDKQTVGQTLHIYGWGDGGGGPDPEMLEQAVRYADFPGLVPTKFSSAEEAFDSIKAAAAKSKIAVLRDEIYLEAHRGTFTHRGRLKKLNRRAELLYREAEIAASAAWLGGAEYPVASLDAGWSDLLTQQMHDAVPGTHIAEVYPELLAGYEKIMAIGEAARSEAVAALGARGGGRSVAVLNSLTGQRSDVVSVATSELDLLAVADEQGRALPQQGVTDLDGTQRTLVQAGPVQGAGVRWLTLTLRRERSGARKAGAARPPRPALQAAGRTLENEHLRAVFDAEGELTSLLDKDHGREALAAGQAGNRFQLFEDTPGKYDAWDIVETYRDHEIDIRGNASLRVDETGPVRTSLILEKRIKGSTLRQRISLCAGSRRLDFETMVDWSERQRLLKVAFPVEVNAEHATYDIAFGSIARPNHRNNSFAAAKFEVPAHQWMDLSQADYGVSLLNDCKYGHDCLGKVMRLTLLKGSISPDPNADVEQHFFTYALYPHAGDWRSGGTVQAAAELNNPLRGRIVPGRAARARVFLRCDAPNLTLEAMKLAEDGQGLVVRLAERHNALTRARLVFDRPVKRAWSCDLMETREQPLAVDGAQVELTARPCEIVTVRLEFPRLGR